MVSVKPRIHVLPDFDKKSPPMPRYVCHDRYYIQGFGDTPNLAYCDWAIKEARRTLIPRKGLWAKDGVLQWYRNGCPTIRSYIDCRQIIGYNPDLDKLILRG